MDKASEITGVGEMDGQCLLTHNTTTMSWSVRALKPVVRNIAFLRMLSLSPERELVLAVLEQTVILWVDQKSLGIPLVFCQ